MAISKINYLPGNTFDYTTPGTSKTTKYSYSMDLAIGRYAMDVNGKDITPQTAPATHKDPAGNLSVRSYYTVTTDEPAYKNYPLTIEGLTQLISTRRARTVEAEIQPMASTIQQRNDALEELGTTLGLISAGLAEFDKNDGKGTNSDGINSSIPGIYDTLKKYFTQDDFNKVGLLVDDNSWNNKELRIVNSLVKSKIDKLNNEAQTDMSRMETLVSKRDESFSLATDLTSTISDGRTSIINNMGG